MTSLSPSPAPTGDANAIERAQRIERARFLSSLTLPQLKSELEGLQAAGEDSDPREAEFLRTLVRARATAAVQQAEQAPSYDTLRRWAAEQMEAQQFDEDFFNEVISPIAAKKLQDTPDFGMEDVKAAVAAVPGFLQERWKGAKGLLANAPMAFVSTMSPVPLGAVTTKQVDETVVPATPEDAETQRVAANIQKMRQARETVGAAFEQGTLEDLDLLTRTVRRAVQAAKRKALLAVNGDTPEKWEATRQKQLATLAAQKPDWTEEQLAAHPSVAPTWEEFNMGKLPLEEGRKQAITDVNTARAMLRAERGQRTVSEFDLSALLLGNNKKDWDKNREAVVQDLKARGLSDKAIQDFVPPTWEEYSASEQAKRPKLTEEQIASIPGMGGFLSAVNYVPVGVGFEFASKLTKPVSAAVKLGEKVAPTAVARVGRAVEKAGEALAAPAGRTVVAASAAAAAGLPPEQVVLAGVLANSPGGRQISKVAPRAVAAAGKLLQRPLPGPVGAMMNIAKTTGAGAISGGATMLPMAYFAGQTPEERGAILASGLSGGIEGAAINGVTRFGESYWAPQRRADAERVASTSYGTPLDRQHAKAVSGLDNAQFNAVEAVRDVVRRASGGNGQLYVLSPEDYAAELTARGQPEGAGSAGVVFDGNTALVRIGTESLMHEPAHIFEHFLLPEERGEILDAINQAYTPEQIQEMKLGYERALGKEITPQQFVSEIIAENFQAALNAGPLRKLGTPTKVARAVYATLGRFGERLGLRDMSPGGNVQTSETLRFTPSFLVQQAMLNVLEAQRLDGLKPSTPQQAAQQAAQTPAAAVPAPAPAPAPAALAAPKTVDVGVLNPAPVELLQEPSIPVPGSISGIEQPKPKATKPAAPAPAPAPAPATTPNVRGVTEVAREPFKGPTAETKAQNERVLTEELNKAQADRVPLQTDYFSAVDADNNPKKLTQPQRELQRRLAEAADRLGYQNPLRKLYDKVFIPLSGFKTAKGNFNIFGFSTDKLIQNLDILRGWAEENGKTDLVATLEDPQLAADVQTYLTNQANGYGGGGERLARPAGTDPARFPAENPDYTPVPLSADRRQFINFLMGLEGVAAKQPMSPAAAFVFELAKANGVEVATTTAPTAERTAKLEFNPVAEQFRQAGFDPVLLNQVVEQLRSDRMGTPLRRREDINLRAGVQGTIQAGFMPSAPNQPVQAENNRGRFANPEVRRVADTYLLNAGLSVDPHGRQIPVSADLAKRIADFYEQAKDAPSAPEVKRAYNALADEVMAQYQAMVDAGVKIEPWLKQGQPYKDSADMMRDVRDNNRLYFFLTEGGFGSGQEASVDNAMLRDSGVEVGGKKLLVNDIFRAVHDYFGHAMNGYEFGPKGEFNAYLEHSRMFSPEAKPALAAETLAQNSWVNYGQHLRDAEGNVAKKGQPGYIAPADRPFAPQKNIVIPTEILDEVDAYARDEAPQFMPAKKEVAPKRDVEYLGVVTEDGVRMVSIPRGSEKFHDEVGLARGDRFRYDPKSGNVVWTDLREEVGKDVRDRLGDWLDARGYKVGRQADWMGRAYGQFMPTKENLTRKQQLDLFDRRVSAVKALDEERRSIAKGTASRFESILDRFTTSDLQKYFDKYRKVANEVGVPEKITEENRAAVLDKLGSTFLWELRAAVQAEAEADFLRELEQKVSLSTTTPPEEIQEAILKEYGEVDAPFQAGLIFPDGRVSDISTSSIAKPGEYHDDVADFAEAFDDVKSTSGQPSLMRLLDRTKAVRYSSGASAPFIRDVRDGTAYDDVSDVQYGVSFIAPPGSSQIKQLAKLAHELNLRAEFTLERLDENGNSQGFVRVNGRAAGNPERIAKEIRGLFESAPQGAQFMPEEQQMLEGMESFTMRPLRDDEIVDLQRRAKDLRRQRDTSDTLNRLGTYLAPQEFEARLTKSGISEEDKVSLRAAFKDASEKRAKAYPPGNNDKDFPSYSEDPEVRKAYQEAFRAFQDAVEAVRLKYDTPLRRGLNAWHNWNFAAGYKQDAGAEAALKKAFDTLPTMPQTTLYRGFNTRTEFQDIAALKPGDNVHFAQPNNSALAVGSNAYNSRKAIGYVPMSEKAAVAQRFSGKAAQGSVVIEAVVDNAKNPEALLRAASGRGFREAERVVPVGTSFEVVEVNKAPRSDRVFIKVKQIEGENIGEPLFMPDTPSEPNDTRVFNIGLNILRSTEQNSPEMVLEKMRELGLDPIRHEVKQSNTEPTLVVEVPGEQVTADIVNTLSQALQQEAIAVYNPREDTGALYGPKAADWGPFNKDYFVNFTEEQGAPTPEEMQFMPAHFAGDKLEHSVPEKTLKLTHFSNVPGLNVVDPSFMSSDTSKKLLRGDPRSFWMVGANKLKGADGAKGKQYSYTAEVSGSKLYDMRSDPLDLWSKPQPSIDKTLKSAGYVGFVMETNDGREFAAVYEPIAFNPKGKKEAAARAKATLAKEKAMAPELPASLQREQAKQVKQDRTWQDVLDESAKSGRPLDEVAKEFGIDTFTLDDSVQFMPAAPRVDIEDFIGRDVIVMPADRLGIGDVKVGPKGAERTMQAQGGRGYPLLYPGEAWAFSQKRPAEILLSRLRKVNPGAKTGLVATTLLTESNLLNSRFGQLVLVNAYDAAIDAGLVSRRKVDSVIKEIFQRTYESSKAPKSDLTENDARVLKSVRSLADFRRVVENEGGVSFTAMRSVRPRFDASRLAIPFEQRAEAGLDTTSIARQVMDPELVGLPNFSITSLIEVDLDQTPHNNTEHVSYPWGVKGRLVGFLTNPVELKSLVNDKRVFNKKGEVQANPVMMTLPNLSGLKVSEANPNPVETLRNARVSSSLRSSSPSSSE